MAMMWGYEWGWGGWLAMAVMMVLFWGLVIFGIVALVHSSRGHREAERPGPASSRTRAEDVLAERFARGEIDEAEYQLRRDLLREHR